MLSDGQTNRWMAGQKDESFIQSPHTSYAWAIIKTYCDLPLKLPHRGSSNERSQQKNFMDFVQNRDNSYYLKAEILLKLPIFQSKFSKILL